MKWEQDIWRGRERKKERKTEKEKERKKGKDMGWGFEYKKCVKEKTITKKSEKKKMKKIKKKWKGEEKRIQNFFLSKRIITKRFSEISSSVIYNISTVLDHYIMSVLDI